MGNRYSMMLEKAPLLTKGVSSAVVAFGGDIMCQSYVEKREVNQPLDYGRATRFTIFGGVMVAPHVRGMLASVRFRAEPSGERRSTREPPPQVQPRRDRHLLLSFLRRRRRPARASSRPSFAKVKLRSRTRTSKSRAISNLTPAPPDIVTKNSF